MCCRQLGFQVVLIALFNVDLTVMCLIEIQLAFVLECFRRSELAFPESFVYVKICLNALRIVSATLALGCNLGVGLLPCPCVLFQSLDRESCDSGDYLSLHFLTHACPPRVVA